jgi:hypothetical protein
MPPSKSPPVTHRVGRPKSVQQWSLATLKEKLVKVSTKVYPSRQIRDVAAGGSRHAPITLNFSPRTGRPTQAVARSVCIRLAKRPQAGRKRAVLADAKGRLCADGDKQSEFHARTKPIGKLKTTQTISVAGFAAGCHAFGATICPRAFLRVVIWDIPSRWDARVARRLGTKRGVQWGH